MAIILTDETALAFWRHSGITGSSLFGTRPCRLARVPSKVAPASDITAACEQLGIDVEPINVLVARKQDFRHNDSVAYSCFSGQLPDRSLLKLNEGLYVTCPEFTFVRLAARVELVPLIRTCYEIAGLFAFNENDMRGFSRCDPLTTTRGISCFLERTKELHLRGHAQARRALKHALDNAASPMEVELAMLLTLPRRLGGYGLPKPVLNYPLDVSGLRGEQLQRKRITVDAAWPKERLVLEYDSDQFHTGSEKIVADSKRRNDIAFLGFEIKTITSREIASIASMDKIADSIRRRLGIRARRFADDFPMKQSDLRRQLIKTLTNTHFAS